MGAPILSYFSCVSLSFVVLAAIALSRKSGSFGHFPWLLLPGASGIGFAEYGKIIVDKTKNADILYTNKHTFIFIYILIVIL